MCVLLAVTKNKIFLTLILAFVFVVGSVMLVPASKTAMAQGPVVMTDTFTFDTDAEGWYVLSDTIIYNGWGYAGWYAHDADIAPDHTGNNLGVFGVYRLEQGNGNGLHNSAYLWYDVSDWDTETYSVTLSGYLIHGKWNDIDGDVTDKSDTWEIVEDTNDVLTETHISGIGLNTWKFIQLTVGGAGKKIKRIGFKFGLQHWPFDPRQNVWIDDVTIAAHPNAFPQVGVQLGLCYLKDPSFDGEYIASLNQAWISPIWLNSSIGAEAPPISGGSAQIGYFDLIAQKIPSLTINSSYTVTFEAKTVNEFSPVQMGLIMGLTKDRDNLLDLNVGAGIYPPGPLGWAYIGFEEYQIYTVTLNAENSTNVNRWFYIADGGGTTNAGDYVDIRWVCITPAGSSAICVVPNKNDFNLNTGKNSGGLFEEQIGSSQGWKGLEYGDLYTAYTKPEKIPIWTNLVASPYASPIGLFSKPAFNFVYNQASAIEYQEFVIPNVITANVIYPKNTDPYFQIWIKKQSETAYGLLSDLFVRDMAISGKETIESDYYSSTVVYSFTNQFRYEPYSLALALKTSNGSSFGANRMGWNWIELSGCFPGDPLAGDDCLFSDPYLEENGGQPSQFYWFGDYGPLEGRAYLEAGNKIFQNISPNRAGAYRLEMLASSYLNGGLDCGFSIDIRDYSTYSIYKTYDLPCKVGLVQSYTLNIELPAVPVEFMITQNSGVLEIDTLCISTPDEPTCINKNPIFINGIKNYNGDFTIADGLAVIAPGASIQAIGVPYGVASTQTFQLEIIAQPVLSGPVNIRFVKDNSAPTVTSPGQAITSTTSITRIIAPLNVNSATGPAVWNYNNATGDSLAISQYCITALTSTIWYGGKNCNTVTNPDFDFGLTGWDNTNVINVGGWVTFDTGGQVSQLVEYDNLISDPSFETGLPAGILQHASFPTTISHSSENSKHENYAIKLIPTNATGLVRMNLPNLETNTDYTIGVWFFIDDVGGTFKLGAREKSTWSIIEISETYDTVGAWQFATVSFNSASYADIVASFAAAGAGNTYFVDAAVLVAGDSVPAEYTSPNDATLHWIAKAPGNTPINATVTVSSTAGVFTSSHTVSGGFNGTEIFDNFTVGGDVQVTVTGDVGLELDYVCLLPGTYTEPGTPGDGGDEPGINIGDGHCAPPPMAVLSGTLNAWLPSIWIWENEATNYEVVGVYSAAWLRYIGCTLTQIAQLLDDKLSTIITLLQALTFLQFIDTLASLLDAIATAIALLEETIDDLVDAITGPVLSLLYILGLIALFFAAVLGLLTLIIGLIVLIWLIPQTFWQSFTDALRSDQIIYVPLPDSEAHPLYNIMVGLQLFNATFAPTWMYTFTIVAIALGSISIVIWTIKRVQVRW